MTDPYENLEPVDDADVPVWEDEYVDRVSDRLMFNYDLEKDYRVDGEAFTLFGEMHIHSQKHFFHPALSYAHNDTVEYLFVRQAGSVTRADLEALVDLGHDLAEEWIEPSPEHFSTNFTFAVVAPSIPPDARSFVEEFRDRTLIKFGYHGHYEINLVAVAPEEHAIVASPNAEVERAFRVWESIRNEAPGLLARFRRRLPL